MVDMFREDRRGGTVTEDPVFGFLTIMRSGSFGASVPGTGRAEFCD
jgi:hypothetical protein